MGSFLFSFKQSVTMPRHVRPSRWMLAAIAATMLPIAPPALEAQGVRFTVAPSAEYVWWDEALPLKDYTLLGLRAGADFGRLIGLTAWYHRGNDIPVALSETSLRLSGAPLANTTTDVETFGANIAFKFGTGAIVPFVHGGAGLIRFLPTAAPRSEQVNYRYGGGIQYDMARNIRATILVEDSRFRLAPEALTAETPDAPSENPRATRSNWTASAALGFAIGGPRGSKGAGADEWSFASVPIEPFVGRLEFDDDNLARQTVAGVRAGVDLGNYVGLRGVYWQGRSDGLGDRQPIQGYGAEAQFNLNASLGLAPFLVAGVQRIDYEEEYRDLDGLVREDENALVLGGGVGLRLTDNFRLNVAARNFIRSGRDLDDISSVDEITHNWMLSAGLAFNIGRSRTTAKERDVEDRGRDRRDRDEREMEYRRAGMPADRDTTARGQMITLPVPADGELYVRYGKSPSIMERLSRSDNSQGTVASTMSEGDIDRIVRLLSARIDSILGQRMERMERMERMAAPPAPQQRAPAQSLRPARPPEDAAPIREPVMEARVDMPTDSGRTLDGVAAYVAGFDALVLGVQLDAGSVFGIKELHFVPEFAIGILGDKSVLFAAGAEYRFGMLRLNETARVRPHARLSLGLLAAGGDTDSQFGFNFAYGATLEPQDGTTMDRKPRIFVEHQGIGFFEQNRLAAGLRWAF